MGAAGFVTLAGHFTDRTVVTYDPRGADRSRTFEIVDRLTGLPRGVKTLSGGETFLASQALALGLVELAGRGGGRLDSLFLDEGFGSLDANSLAEALDALGRQAETGRLVAVISHLRSVAEAMDRVLAITAAPAGSRAHWLGGDERDELIAEDVEAGLLRARAGIR